MKESEQVLSLYLKMRKGERINKTEYCVEIDRTTRSFERYINCIKTCLMAEGVNENVKYDRLERKYYIEVLE